MTCRRVIDAIADSKGVITHVKFAGNQRFTSVERAIDIAERHGLETAHVVRRKNAKPHLRSNPDNKTSNNLDEMAGDT